ncbi:EAL and HDOD domain-containing protein [Vibrio agarivorans]|uniref:EAL domain-containing protein n=1 Tax=Vibrio agarivorans TaxID=153622 RepID=A0ABT7Y7F7_9VIBR|nr:EAL domain-containing protein [Vibrio agarivorans]MDN2483981.1 EAL domain-containing protein [Vibrio agarivorans]
MLTTTYSARQSIYTHSGIMHGCEVLFRDSLTNSYPLGFNPTVATASVIVNSLFKHSFNEKELVFVNFDYNSLLRGIPHLLNPKQVVVEVLEDVSLTTPLIDALLSLKSAGYRIAIDDFNGDFENYKQILRFADYLKVDISDVAYEHIPRQIAKRGLHDIKLIAERVETRKQLNSCVTAGYDYFQGYYFSKPLLFAEESYELHTSVARDILSIFNKGMGNDLSSLLKLVTRDEGLLRSIISYCNRDRDTGVCSIQMAAKVLGRKNTVSLIWLLAQSALAPLPLPSAEESVTLSAII